MCNSHFTLTSKWLAETSQHLIKESTADSVNSIWQCRYVLEISRCCIVFYTTNGCTRVTRMAYSPSLWLMANWLVKQNQPVSKIETKPDTNLRSLYESWFRNALISTSVIL